MNISFRDNEVEITGFSDFDLAKTFECGQCFRWNTDENGDYIGVAHGQAARLRSRGDSIIISCPAEDYKAVWHDYFDLDRDYSAIRSQLCIDEFMQQATDFGAGIRILKQNKWEALCSFIISQNNNIPRIKSIVNKLCSMFGNSIDFEGTLYYTFPSADRLAMFSAENLADLRCGYRAEYIIRTAKAVADGAIDLDELSLSTPDAARAALKRLHGVGDKVADCVLLFGLHMLDAFPVDVWMKRAVANHFDTSFDPAIFTPHAGIAQQYIFHYIRNGSTSAIEEGVSMAP